VLGCSKLHTLWVLVNGITAQVRTDTSVSGNPTSRELTPQRQGRSVIATDYPAHSCSPLSLVSNAMFVLGMLREFWI
jgi:hypothetical protein